MGHRLVRYQLKFALMGFVPPHLAIKVKKPDHHGELTPETNEDG